MTDWFCLEEAKSKQVEHIYRYFRDRETEFETGELVLPGWAAIGNVAAQYGQADDADPFAPPPEPFPPPDE